MIGSRRRARIALAALALAGAVHCDESDECNPADYGGGSQCGEEPGTYASCDYQSCIEGPFCSRDRYVIRELDCPAETPLCVQVARGVARCVAEDVGPCPVAGFVACEDAVTVLRCGDDGRLRRGACGLGSFCDEADPSFSGGCR